MGEKLSRREFVKRAAVAAAGAAFAGGVLSGPGRALVRQAVQSLKMQAAAAEDPDPEPDFEGNERTRLIVEMYRQLEPEGRRVITAAIREMYARHCSRVS